MITHPLAVGLCEGDGACLAGASAAGGGGVYSFNRIKAEAEKAVEHAIPILGWIRDAWKWLDDVGKLEGLMAFAVIVGSMLKLLFHIARRQMGLWWSDRQETKLRHPRREEYERVSGAGGPGRRKRPKRMSDELIQLTKAGMLCV